MRYLPALMLTVLCAAPLHAEDLTGRLGAGGALGAGVPVGADWVSQHATVGPLLGLFTRYGVNKNLSLGLSYDNLGFGKGGIRVEPILVNGYLNLMPDSPFNPNVHFGVGGADVSRDEVGRQTTFANKLGAGADYFLNKNISVGGFMDYLLAWYKSGTGQERNHEIHGFLFGATVAYWFEVCRPRPAHAAAPAPAPVVVGIALTPVAASVAAGSSLAFSADVSGTPRKDVTWSLEPYRGTITDAGLYTAPAVVAAEQTITIKATSQADPSKSAEAQVTLLPAPPALVGVALVPADASLAAGGSQAFSASVSGSSNPAVTWSLEPAVGTVTEAGVYTAPAVIAAEQTVSVKATSQADPSKSAASQVKLLPAKVEMRLSVEFDLDKDVVKPQYDEELKKVAQFLKDFPAAQAAIEGHTDSHGDAGYNVRLSQRRADAVRQALISRFGAPAERLTAKGYGSSKPVADNGTLEGRAQNRRVVAAFTGIK